MPHGTETLRSWSISEHALRGAIWGGVLLAAVLLTGSGTIALQLWRLGSRPAMAATTRVGSGLTDDVGALRSRVADLNNALDTIRSADAKLRDVASARGTRSDSVALLLQARTDSLLRHASVVAKDYGSLADSATKVSRIRQRPIDRPVSRTGR
ncbi:MAG: hypothetical protein ABIT38_09765 [Gemmatimonadaceae bacterium]